MNYFERIPEVKDVFLQNIKPILNTLEKTGIFKQFKYNDLIQISSFCKEQLKQKGEILYKEGTEGKVFYIVSRGEFKRTKTLNFER